MAEGAGFEPAIRFPAYTLSRRAPSTTRPPLRCSVSWIKESTYALPVGFLKSLGMPYAPERRATIVRRAASASELWRCRQTIRIHGYLSCGTSRRKPGLSLASLWRGDRQACAQAACRPGPPIVSHNKLRYQAIWHLARWRVPWLLLGAGENTFVEASVKAENDAGCWPPEWFPSSGSTTEPL